MDPLASAFSRLATDDELSDLTLTCQGREFKVHKVVACSHSPVLKKALTGSFIEARLSVYDILEYDPITVEFFINFIYKGAYTDTPLLTRILDEVDEGLAQGGEAPTSPRTWQSKLLPSYTWELQDDGETGHHVMATSNAHDRERLKACSAEDSLPQSVLAMHMRLLIEANSIGDYFQVPAFIEHVNEALQALLDGGGGGGNGEVSKRAGFSKRDTERHLGAALPLAVEMAAARTGDAKIQLILARAMAKNLSHVTSAPTFEAEALGSAFVADLLTSCAEEMARLARDRDRLSTDLAALQTRHDSSERESAHALSLVKNELALRNADIALANKVARCRNYKCQSEFAGYIDLDKRLIRCRHCWSKNK